MCKESPGPGATGPLPASFGSAGPSPRAVAAPAPNRRSRWVCDGGRPRPLAAIKGLGAAGTAELRALPCARAPAGVQARFFCCSQCCSHCPAVGRRQFLPIFSPQ